MLPPAAPSLSVDYRFIRPQPSAQGGQPMMLLTVQAPSLAAQRIPATIVFLVDCSMSMFYSLLPPEELQRWKALAQSRGELKRIVADGREKLTVVGQTKQEMVMYDVTPMHGVHAAVSAVAHDILREDDVSIVGFADRGELLHQGSDPAAMQAVMTALLRRQYAQVLGGQTYMAEAMTKVTQWLEWLAAQQRRKPNTEIIVISDGVVADAPQATALLANPQLTGACITAIGYGVDFDQNLLCYLADRTQGTYIFAQTAEEIAPAIRTTFQRLQNAVVSNTWLQLKPAWGVRFGRAYRVLPEVGDAFLQPTEGGWMALQLGSLTAGEQHAVLVEVAMPEGMQGQALAEAALSATFPSGEVASQNLSCQDDPGRWEEAGAATFGAQLAGAVEPYKLGHAAEEAERTGELEQARDLYHRQAECLRAMGQPEEAEMAEQHALDLVRGQAHGRVPTRQLRQHTRKLTRKIARPDGDGG